MSDMLSTVLYRDIPGFPGYRVGDDGSVWSCRKHNRYRVTFSDSWHRLAVCRGRQRYLRVKLCCGATGKYVRRLVHHLVLEAFAGRCPDGMEGCHANDIKTDNRLVNLRWDTKKGNAADAMRNGRYDVVRGRRHHKAKLDECAVREIRSRHAAGETCKALALFFGVSGVLISLIVRRKSWTWLK